MSHEFYENPLIRRYASPEMSRLWGEREKIPHLAAALGLAGRGRGRAGPADHAGADRGAAPQHRRHRFRRRRCARAPAAARRDGPRPRLRRSCPDGPADHSPGGHELLRDRQHRSDADARGPGDAGRAAGGGDRSAGHVRRADTATWPAWASRICSRPSRRPSASGPACGPTTWCWTWPKSSIGLRSSRPAA